MQGACHNTYERGIFRMDTTVSRRNLIKGAALGAAAMGLTAGASALASEKASSASADAPAWDAEYDVVVLGLGGAGANAAVAAYEEGATVLVCEKAPEGQEPCNTKASGQFVIATDDADQLYTYFSQLMGKFNNWDEDALRGMCEGAAGNWEWMTGPLGADPELVCPPEDKNPVDNFPMEAAQGASWRLTENAWGLGRSGYVYHWDEFPEIPESQHCLCLTASGTRFDASYYNLCINAVNARVDGEKLTVWKSCAGKRLVTDETGAVTGVIVEKDGEELAIKANGGVCLCTGGFEANADMISDFTQLPYTYLQAGTTNTGDGIKMAQQVGAQLWHMSNVSGYMWTHLKDGLTTANGLGGANAAFGIYAGLDGSRFQNEQAATRHGRISIGGRWISTPMPLPAYLIIDSVHIAEKPMGSGFSADNSEEIASGEIISGETIEELSAKIREQGDAPDFNANGELDKALEKYNAHCHANDGAGEEDDYGRMCTVPVETGPFYAMKIGPTLFNTQGGPRRNQFAQVINTEGMPIPGLFEGGEMGSVFADMYNGGGNLSETMVFGRFAGMNAAKRAKGEFEGATEKALTHQEKLAAEAAAAAGAANELASDYADGTYEGSGQGYGGKMTVSVTVEGGKIAKVEVVDNAETPTIGGQALPVYAEAAPTVSNLDDIDIASGASNTLKGFKAAVMDALSQAK